MQRLIKTGKNSTTIAKVPSQQNRKLTTYSVGIHKTVKKFLLADKDLCGYVFVH